MQFAVKEKRFGKDDTISPGPAAYKLPDSCQVRNPNAQLSSYVSKTERDLKHIVGKNNPGVGEYSIGDDKAINSPIGKGGGAPANFVLGLPHLNPTIRRVETVVSPRLPYTEHRSKFNTLLKSFLILTRILSLLISSLGCWTRFLPR